MMTTTINLVPLKIMYGKETFKDKSAKVAIWGVPCASFPELTRETHISSMLSNGMCMSELSKIGSLSKNSARNSSGYRDALGSWTFGNVNVAEGGILKVFAQRSMGHGRRRNLCNVLLRMREDAALRQVKILLTNHVNASYTFADVVGRFDILTSEQAKLRGVAIDSNFLHTYAVSGYDNFIEINTIEEERAPYRDITVREVVTASGEVKQVRRIRKSRVLDIDK